MNDDTIETCMSPVTILHPCRFCGNPSVARFTFTRGCFCYPNDTEQDLCPQHVINAEPLGTMELAEVYEQEVWSWMVGNAAGRQRPFSEETKADLNARITPENAP